MTYSITSGPRGLSVRAGPAAQAWMGKRSEYVLRDLFHNLTLQTVNVTVVAWIGKPLVYCTNRVSGKPILFGRDNLILIIAGAGGASNFFPEHRS